MIIGSFDVGITNLAFCVLDTTTGKIDAWQLFTLPKHTDAIPAALLALFARDQRLSKLSLVLVEKQPGRNRTMVRVEAYLSMLMAALGVRAKLYSAARKLAMGEADVNFRGKSRDAYKLRKRASVMLTRQYLSETAEVNGEYIDYYAKSNKKDDLADSLLQAVSYAGTWVPRSTPQQQGSVAQAPAATSAESVSSAPPPVSRSDILVNTRPRVPTVNQARRGTYSMSNILHFWKESGHEAACFTNKVNTTRGLGSSIQRYFSDLPQCLAALPVAAGQNPS